MTNDVVSARQDQSEVKKTIWQPVGTLVLGALLAKGATMGLKVIDGGTLRGLYLQLVGFVWTWYGLSAVVFPWVDLHYLRSTLQRDRRDRTSLADKTILAAIVTQVVTGGVVLALSVFFRLLGGVSHRLSSDRVLLVAMAVPLAVTGAVGWWANLRTRWAGKVLEL